VTATEFRAQHGDPTTWTTTDIESYDVIRRNDAYLARRSQDTPKYTLRTRLTFQAHALYRIARNTAQAIRRTTTAR
jgi:hypothetical protein